ncbi:hypothetical protein MUO32_06200 [Shinella sp. CPCC 101442]|nr:hypothetical protein [Shinella sp. CPCC 101442]MCR6498613.1 hypothetical protein [Shinella sp. CPCC 101442]
MILHRIEEIRQSVALDVKHVVEMGALLAEDAIMLAQKEIATAAQGGET